MKREFLLGVVIGVGVLTFALYTLLNIHPRILISFDAAREWSISKLAQDIIADCAQAKHQNVCFDKEVPKLMDEGLSMEDTFDVLRAMVSEIPEYSYCHVVAHTLGSKETAKDSGQWMDVSARCPTDMCAYGCFHGVVEARFFSESLPDSYLLDLLPTLISVCREGKEGAYTRLGENICQHGLGHLVMFATSGNVSRSLAACDALTELAKETDPETDVKKFCYEGAFMQIFQTLSEEEKALVHSFAPTTPAEAVTYCSNFPTEQAATCYRESWPLSVHMLDTAQGITDFCETSQNPQFIKQCYNKIFHTTTSRFSYSEERIAELCSRFEGDRKGHCFAYTASSFVYTDPELREQASALCTMAGRYGVGERCFRGLLYFSTYGYKDGSAEFKLFCDALPEEWQKKCLAGEDSGLSPFELNS